MAKEITVSGHKKVGTLMKEFNEMYPYLRLGIFPPEVKETVKEGGSISNVDREKKISEVWTKKGSKDITFSGNKKVSTIEKEFWEEYGLFVQICYTTKDGKRYYTTGSDDEKTLSALNKEKEEAGCKKGEWK